ncbi:MAG: hypothetical protein L0922_06225, partial [Candidatus Mariimomonas ferrooxydans]
MKECEGIFLITDHPRRFINSLSCFLSLSGMRFPNFSKCCSMSGISALNSLRLHTTSTITH